MKNYLKINLIEKMEKQDKLFKKRLRSKVKKSNLNYKALKFEYQALYKIIEEEVKKLKVWSFGNVINECYLVNMHKYFQNPDLIRTNEKISLELLACFYKAVIEEPIFVNVIIKDKFVNINRSLIENVIKATGYKLNLTKKESIDYYDNLYIQTGNDVYLFASRIIKEIL